MICQNCGAEYEDDSLICPYCHSENEREAKKQKQQILGNYDREAAAIREDMENFPKRTARKWTFYLLWGVGVLFAAGILITAGILIFGQVSAESRYQAEREHLAKLESFCEAGEYDAVTEYLRAHDLWSSAYDKYKQISDVQRAYVDFEENLAQLEQIATDEYLTAEDKEKYFEFWLEYAAEKAHKVLYYGDMFSKDRVILGNEEVLIKYYDLCADRLVKMGYTQEELEDFTMTEDADIISFMEKMRAYYTSMIK